MKPYEYEGTVVHVGELRKFPSGFAVRSVVLCADPDAEFVDHAVFDAMKTKSKDWSVEAGALRKGDHVTVKFYVSANESKKNPGQWFGSLRIAGIERPAAEVAAAAKTPSVPEPPKSACAAATAEEVDDLPF